MNRKKYKDLVVGELIVLACGTISSICNISLLGSGLVSLRLAKPGFNEYSGISILGHELEEIMVEKYSGNS